MAKVTIYHNPRCSKSRQTLKLIMDRGIEPVVVEYMKTPPDKSTLADIVRKLRMQPRELVREKEHQSLDLPQAVSDVEWISQMATHPQIMERPIVVNGDQARIGRPPENVLEIL